MAAVTMEPTFRGFIDTTHDALVLLEACIQQQCDRVSRRLQEKERSQITSGSVYVFDEEESRIKRWTDGRMWSPSRILGNFLVYRELDKRTAEEESLGVGGLSRAEEERLYGGVTDESSARGRNRERSLVGSLTSTFKFKKGGLVKKTLSVGTLHLICYYCVEDVLEGRLRTPASLPELRAFSISAALLSPTSFRVPPKIEYAPDGTPIFVAERDENAPPRPSSGRSSFASTSSSILSPADTDVTFSTNNSDYFALTVDNTGSAPSSASSGELRLGSGEKPSHDYSPRIVASPLGSGRGAAVARTIPIRNRHSPYGSNRAIPSNMNLPQDQDLPHEYQHFRNAESFPVGPSLGNQRLYQQQYEQMPPSPASATFGYSVPPLQEALYGSFDSTVHRNSVPGASRPFTSYEMLPLASSPQAPAPFSRSLSDYGRARERAQTGPSSLAPHEDQQSSPRHLSWHSENGLIGLPQSNHESTSYSDQSHPATSLFPAMYQISSSHGERPREPPMSAGHPALPSHSAYYNDAAHYTPEASQCRASSPRFTVSPFHYQPPSLDRPPSSEYQSGGQPMYSMNYGRRGSAFNSLEAQPKPTGMVQPIPVYPSQMQRPAYNMDHEPQYQEKNSLAQHVPVWLQQQQVQLSHHR